MTVEKISVSLDERLGSAIRVAAREAGVPLSVWVSRAVRAQLRGEALDQYLKGWQAEHGAFAETEIVAAEVRLGYRKDASGAA